MPFDTLAMEDCSVVATVNGLLCLSDELDFGRTMCLWNPSIRKSKTLLSSSSTFPSAQFSDPMNYFSLGFGFLSLTNDYKIVRILYCILVNTETPPPLVTPLLVEVYSLSTDSWRRIEAPVPCNGCRERSDVVLNGCLHWVASKSVAHPDHYKCIMSFDIGDELFGEMALPNYDVDARGWIDLKLAVLVESLSLCVCYGEAGIKTACGFTNNNVLFLETWGNNLAAYDVGSLQLKDLGISVADYTTDLFLFMETLVLL